MGSSEGIYFIAAGSSSKNRSKTLDKSWRLSDVKSKVPNEIAERLELHFSNGKNVYAWGANQSSFNQLSQVKSCEYVIDVKNKEVVRAFKFCFWYKTSDTKIQELFGWDKEKPKSKRRPYQYVYFLSDPIPLKIKNKEYFQQAFDQMTNPQWLVGQKYFNSDSVQKAMNRKNCSTIDELIGVTNLTKNPPISKPYKPKDSVKIIKSEPEIRKKSFWQWFLGLFS